jgi:hypothetical protein
MLSKSHEEQQRLVEQFREECLTEGVITPESEPAHDEHILLCVACSTGIWNLENN